MNKLQYLLLYYADCMGLLFVTHLFNTAIFKLHKTSVDHVQNMLFNLIQTSYSVKKLIE